VPDALAYRHTIDVRQTEIEDDEIGVPLLNQLECLLSACCLLRPKALEFKLGRDCAADGFLIVYDQDQAGLCLHGSPFL
jgi:hypothetical protein